MPSQKFSTQAFTDFSLALLSAIFLGVAESCQQDSCAGCTNALLFICNCYVPHAVAIRRQYLHKHFALAKPHSLLSAVVTVSTITAVSEAAKMIRT